MFSQPKKPTPDGFTVLVKRSGGEGRRAYIGCEKVDRAANIILVCQVCVRVPFGEIDPYC